jgi:hypothetical protein
MADRTFHVYTKTEGNQTGVFAIDKAVNLGVDPPDIHTVAWSQSVTVVKRYTVKMASSSAAPYTNLGDAIKAAMTAIYEGDAVGIENPTTYDFGATYTNMRAAGPIFSITPSEALPTQAELTQGRVYVSGANGSSISLYTPSTPEVIDHINEVVSDTLAVTGTIDPITGVITDGLIGGNLSVDVDHF